jgi:hypothetical protein
MSPLTRKAATPLTSQPLYRCPTPRAASRRANAGRPAIREVLLVGALFLAYKVARLAVQAHAATATANAWTIWHLERWVGLPSEASVQRGLVHHDTLVYAANSFYAYVHFPATAACLIWCYLRRPAHYRWFRRVLATLTGAALVVHAFLPVAPPRMLAATGIIDTGRVYGPAVYGSPSTDTLTNQYAAMPSLHVAWALAVALALIATTQGRYRWLWLAHPLATAYVVIVTGNHYWLDALAGIALLALALAVIRDRPALFRRWPVLASTRPVAERLVVGREGVGGVPHPRPHPARHGVEGRGPHQDHAA